MSFLKKILDFLISIPNYPFIVIVILYILYKTYKENGLAETTMALENDELDDFIVDRADMLYPERIQILVATIFYITLIMIFLK